MRVGIRSGVGIGDGDATEALAADDLWRRLRIPGRVFEVEMIAGVAVRPPVDGDREDVTLGVESAGAEEARQHAADFDLVIVERHGQHLRAGGPRLAREAGGRAAATRSPQRTASRRRPRAASPGGSRRR